MVINKSLQKSKNVQQFGTNLTKAKHVEVSINWQNSKNNGVRPWPGLVWHPTSSLSSVFGLLCAWHVALLWRLKKANRLKWKVIIEYYETDKIQMHTSAWTGVGKIIFNVLEVFYDHRGCIYLINYSLNIIKT